MKPCEDTPLNLLRATAVLAASAVFSLVGHVACSNYAGSCRHTNTCEPNDDDDNTGAAGGFGNGDGSEANSPAGSCDPTKTPHQDACVIADSYAVFVSPKGSDSTDAGTKSRPLKTIAVALARAQSAHKRVYLCGDEGPFNEDVTIDAGLDGMEIYGGFRCKGFEYAAGAHTEIISQSSTAWNVTGLVQGLHLEDLAIRTADATAAGESSFGMVISECDNVVLKRVSVQAGAAGDGETGSNGTTGLAGETTLGLVQEGLAADCDGSASTNVGGRWAQANSCGSRGGDGGSADGGNGTAGLPRGSFNGGAGSTSGAGQPGGAGATGAMGESLC